MEFEPELEVELEFELGAGELGVLAGSLLDDEPDEVDDPDDELDDPPLRGTAVCPRAARGAVSDSVTTSEHARRIDRTMAVLLKRNCQFRTLVPTATLLPRPAAVNPAGRGRIRPVRPGADLWRAR